MISGVFALDLTTGKRVFRSEKSMPLSRMNHYLVEFASKYTGGKGTIEWDAYNYVYHTSDDMCFVAIATKGEPLRRVEEALEHIARNSTTDLFDVLVAIDSMLICGILIKADIPSIKSMESQDEKIYNAMMENKNLEKRKREKERMKALQSEQAGMPPKPQNVIPIRKPQRVEKSSQPILFVIKEKLRIVIDKEGYLKENTLSGEMSMVISDEAYRDVQVKMKNLRGDVKYSPYLDKAGIKQGIFRFTKERGINKNIPLLKWAGKTKEVPFSINYWNDEDDGRQVHVLEIKARLACQNIHVEFSKEDMTDIELSDKLVERERCIEWNIGSLKKDESVSCEVKALSFDSEGIFPANMKLSRDRVETPIAVEYVMQSSNKISNYEVRQVVETEYLKIVNE